MEFLNSPDGAPWRDRFAGLTDAASPDGAFATTWRAIAKAEPQAFFNAQCDYIKHSNYDPVVRRILAATGVDIDNQSLAVRNAVWSTAVQHGAAAKIVTRAIYTLKGGVAPGPDGQRALINAIYDARAAYVRSLRAYSDPKTAQTFHDQMTRYEAERIRALNLLSQSR